MDDCIGYPIRGYEHGSGRVMNLPKCRIGAIDSSDQKVPDPSANVDNVYEEHGCELYPNHSLCSRRWDRPHQNTVSANNMKSKREHRKILKDECPMSP
jgi:hypothetical protein